MTNEILKYDNSNMYNILSNFPKQLSDALNIANDAPVFPKKLASSDFLILGMGGSAIGGDILKSYLYSSPAGKYLRIEVKRNYELPQNTDSTVNIIASSYSGNTEETIATFKQSIYLQTNSICITSGGELKQIADQFGIPSISIPSGMQPRCAIGYSFIPMLVLLLKSNAIETALHKYYYKSIDDLLATIAEKAKIYSQFTDENPAFILATQLHNTIPVIYSGAEFLETINLRWRAQINENAKSLAFGNYAPEMNHNEINAWQNPSDLIQRFSIILLRDIAEHSRNQIRMDAIAEILSLKTKLLQIQSDADSLLARMFDLLYLGDWVSFYLALLSKQDPTPIPMITELKNILSKKKH